VGNPKLVKNRSADKTRRKEKLLDPERMWMIFDLPMVTLWELGKKDTVGVKNFKGVSKK